jgi:hypothetical protein
MVTQDNHEQFIRAVQILKHPESVVGTSEEPFLLALLARAKMLGLTTDEIIRELERGWSEITSIQFRRALDLANHFHVDGYPKNLGNEHLDELQNRAEYSRLLEKIELEEGGWHAVNNTWRLAFGEHIKLNVFGDIVDLAVENPGWGEPKPVSWRVEPDGTAIIVIHDSQSKETILTVTVYPSLERKEDSEVKIAPSPEVQLHFRDQKIVHEVLSAFFPFEKVNKLIEDLLPEPEFDERDEKELRTTLKQRPFLVLRAGEKKGKVRHATSPDEARELAKEAGITSPGEVIELPWWPK